MITIMSKDKLTKLVTQQVDNLLSDEHRRRSIAMEYLLELTAGEMNKFLKAVELRKQSDKLLNKLDEQEPDVDKAMDEAFYLDTDPKDNKEGNEI